MDRETGIREKLLTNFDINFMVEAGAGAGKTTLIIDRVLNQITVPGRNENTMKLDEIAAITFTEKAANELKIRVALGIDKRIRETSDEDERRLLLEAKLSIDDQFVGTIHSFCQEILRKNSFEAGLGLDYKVIDPKEDSDIRDLVWQNHLLHDGQILDPIMKRLDELELTISDAKAAFDLITGHEYSIIDYDETAFEREAPLGEMVEGLKPLLRFFRPGVDGELETKYAEPLKKVLNGPERTVFEPYFFQPTNRGCVELVKALIAKNKKDEIICSKNYAKTDNGNELLELVDIGMLENAYDEFNIYKYDVIMSIAYPALENYTRYKRKIMAVNFDDLLVLSRNLLRDSIEARERVRKKYKCIYIDEYQDTDAIQTEIMFYLNGESKDESEPWCDRRLIPGSTFIVGDPKQSIYRFRGADITQYNRVKDIFELDSQCETVILKRNYRTQSGIIEWVEKAFKLSEDTCDELLESGNGSSKFLMNTRVPYQASFYGMDAQRIDTESQDPNIVKGVYSFLAGNEDKVDDYRSTEALWVAGYIDRLVKEGFILETYDTKKETVERRAIGYDDFLILLYYTKGMTDYITALKEKNIPVSYAGRLKLGDIEEIANYIDLVQYLANPSNESLLCNVLINCFRINGLEDWKKINEDKTEKTINLCDYLVDPTLDTRTDPIFEALKRVKRLLRLKEKMTPIAFLKKLLDEFEIIYTNSYNETLVRSVAGTLHFLIEKLSVKNLVSFEIAARELTLLKELDTDREMLLQDSSKSDNGYVRIMNLHKAKGLESPIVILATGGREFQHKPDIATRQTTKGREVHIKLQRGNSLVGYCRGWRSVEDDEKLSLDAETLRLHYVATTRPINALVISSWKNNSWKRYRDMAMKEIPCEFPVKYLEKGSLYILDEDKAKQKRSEIETKREGYVESSSKSGYRELRPSKAEENLEKYGYSMTSGFKYRGPSGEDWGTVVHRVFELYFRTCGYDLEDCPEEGEVSRIIDRAVDEFIEIADFSNYKNQLSEILNSFVSNPEVKMISESAKLLPELRFDIIRRSPDMAEYITGIIDLMISANEGVYLMDYKTNIPRGDLGDFQKQMIELYKPQLNMYREFVEGTMEKKVLGTYMYLTVLDKVVEVHKE